MLKRYSSTSAELGCLVVSPQYRRQGTGDAMLGFRCEIRFAGGVLGLGDWASTRTLLWDRMPDGPLRELVARAYSKRGGARVGRAADFGGRTVLFSRLVFHLESPAGIVFPKVAGPEGASPSLARVSRLARSVAAAPSNWSQ